jgi:Protein of unknown function (DUF3048) N-terminal domain/Protein of unknown function (DUF3048) C-terminal domain
MPSFLRNLSRNQKIGLSAVGVAVVIALTGAFAMASSGSDDGDDQRADPTTTTTEATTTTTVPPTAPLTGQPGDPGFLSRPALIVKVDNTPKAFVVQEGIDQADVVVVEQVEGGVTRLAVVFHSHDTVVGPVRSARTSDIAIARNFGRPLFAFSGANGGVLAMVRETDALVDAGVDRGGDIGGVYGRNRRGTGLLRFFIPTQELYAVMGGEGQAPPPLFTYRPAGQPSNGGPVNGLNVTYGGGRLTTTMTYEWNGTSWDRSQDGRAHVMANGPRISPANVVVLVTPYRDSGFVDVTGAPSPEAVLEGGGEAFVLTDGKLVGGRWQIGPDGRIALFDAANLPIGLTPGPTWLELSPTAPAAF